MYYSYSVIYVGSVPWFSREAFPAWKDSFSPQNLVRLSGSMATLTQAAISTTDDEGTRGRKASDNHISLKIMSLG